jgi:hypothetical protein
MGPDAHRHRRKFIGLYSARRWPSRAGMQASITSALLCYDPPMKKEIFKDVMWLFHELGLHLKPKVKDAPEKCDTRTLLRILAQERPSINFGERDPFNWLKELQATANFWHHLTPESDIPEDDLWRDLDTMERVAKHLGLGNKFIEEVQGVKDRIWGEKSLEDGESSETEIRSWISEEVARQLRAADVVVDSRIAQILELPKYVNKSDLLDTPRGVIADRVRDFVIATYIEPARAEGQKKVAVRAGDVDKALGYRYRRLPLICAALRSQKFIEAGKVKLVGESGPPSGASTTTTFTYELEPHSSG